MLHSTPNEITSSIILYTPMHVNFLKVNGEGEVSEKWILHYYWCIAVGCDSIYNLHMPGYYI
jgi:hypothetical protein